jgi:hypothetical protein
VLYVGLDLLVRAPSPGLEFLVLLRIALFLHGSLQMREMVDAH